MKNISLALFGFSHNNITLILNALDSTSKSNKRLLLMKILLQSLNVWGNFGNLRMNKEYLQSVGSIVLNSLQELKTSDNQ
jgi:hypothetical protein